MGCLSGSFFVYILLDYKNYKYHAIGNFNFSPPSHPDRVNALHPMVSDRINVK